VFIPRSWKLLCYASS